MERRARQVAAIAIVLTLACVIAACGSTGDDSKAASVEQERPAASDSGSGVKITPEGLPTAVGTEWTTAHYGGQAPAPLELKVAGPWTIEAKDDWPTTTDSIVDPGTVPGIDKFSDYDHVVRGKTDDAADMYYVRKKTDEWLLQLGEIQVMNGVANPQLSEKPLKFWPMNFAVGDEYVVDDTADFRIVATILAQSTANVPAGKIEGAYLVRFTYTPGQGGAPSTYYYILAPKVGFVALLHFSAGNEADGFTAADQIDVLATLPVKK